MKLKVNEDTWDIELVSADSKKMNPDEDTVNLGLTECLKHRIYIRKGMDEITTRQTVIHELVHAYIFSFGYEIESEEAACNFFGSQGSFILKDAKRVLSELFKNKNSGRNNPKGMLN